MALIIEDGSIVPNSDSFATVAEARAYLEAIGVDTSGDDDTTVEQWLRRGLRSLCSRYESRLSGSRVDATQLWCVPRSNMCAHGFTIASDVIPDDFKNARRGR